MKTIYNHNCHSDPKLTRYSKMPLKDAELLYKNRKYKIHQELTTLWKRRSSSLNKKSKRFKKLKILKEKQKNITFGKFIIYNMKFPKRKRNFLRQTRRKIKTTQNFDTNKSLTRKPRRKSYKFSRMNISKKYKSCKKK